MDNLAKEILKGISLEEIAPKAQKRSPVDHWTPAILLERAAYLRKMAKYGDGSASETIKVYPQHIAMLSVRSRNGDAEMHQSFAHMFYVLAGTATLVTSGTLFRARTVGPGEKHGDSIEGGTSQELRAGDIVHVPAGIPHQILIAGEKAITCLVVKILEVP
ncbi:MAG TPA: cupin domain-containing protein [Terracidiphilus sp.]|jgi:quercetin dioxygenase-like cupin family protein|nr:cupin domain-containing protein [Terracidiphilus sp.]